MSNHAPHRRPTSPARRGFTLVELLIVVIILGILAAIVVPQFTNAAQTARETTLKDLTQFIRSQATVYKSQHRDIAPGIAAGATSATSQDFIEQMTMYTDENGATSNTPSAQYKFGPYLPKVPTNPLSNLSTLTIVGSGSSIPSADNTSGWLYKPDSLEIVPNSTGTDATGSAFTSY